MNNFQKIFQTNKSRKMVISHYFLTFRRKYGPRILFSLNFCKPSLNKALKLTSLYINSLKVIALLQDGQLLEANTIAKKCLIDDKECKRVIYRSVIGLIFLWITDIVINFVGFKFWLVVSAENGDVIFAIFMQPNITPTTK